jgi:hypothetical protein
MTAPLIGDKVRMNYVDKSGFRYVLHVEILSVTESDRFVGRVGSVFAEGNGEITGGQVLDDLRGKEITFSASDFAA